MSSDEKDSALPPEQVTEPGLGPHETVFRSCNINRYYFRHVEGESWNFSQNTAHSAFHSLRSVAMFVTQPQNPDSQTNGSFVSRSVVGGSEAQNITITPDAREVALQGQSIHMSVGSIGVLTTSAPRIARPPAARLIRVLGRVFTRSAFEGMIEPFVAQEQHEYYEALVRGEFRQAKWIAVRMYLLIGYNLLAAAVASVLRLLSWSAG